MINTRISYQIEGEVATILLMPREGKPPTLDGDVLEELELHWTSVSRRHEY